MLFSHSRPADSETVEVSDLGSTGSSALSCLGARFTLTLQHLPNRPRVLPLPVQHAQVVVGISPLHLLTAFFSFIHVPPAHVALVVLLICHMSPLIMPQSHHSFTTCHLCHVPLLLYATPCHTSVLFPHCYMPSLHQASVTKM